MNQSEKEPLINNAEFDVEEKSTVENSEDNLSESDEKTFETEKNEGTPSDTDENAIDYEKLAAEDMKELIILFPHLEGKTSVRELDNPLRYAALRDLGLSPKEAYLATSEPVSRYDNRSHLRSAVPRGAGSGSDMLSAKELEAARELFSGLSDREIQKLYKKVSK